MPDPTITHPVRYHFRHAQPDSNPASQGPSWTYQTRHNPSHLGIVFDTLDQILTQLLGTILDMLNQIFIQSVRDHIGYTRPNPGPTSQELSWMSPADLNPASQGQSLTCQTRPNQTRPKVKFDMSYQTLPQPARDVVEHGRPDPNLASQGSFWA